MGWGGLKLFEVDVKARRVLGQCRGKSAALEAAGLIFRIFSSFLNNDRAREFAEHAHEGRPIRPGAFTEIVRMFVAAVKQYMQVFTKRLAVILEGLPYHFKKETCEKRAAASANAYHHGKYKKAAKVCLLSGLPCMLMPICRFATACSRCFTLPWRRSAAQALSLLRFMRQFMLASM